MNNKSRWILFPCIIILLILSILPALTGCSSATSATSATSNAPAKTTAAATSTAAASTAAAKVETIEVNYIVPARGLVGQEIETVQKWMDAVEADSNGQVKFNVLVGATTDQDLYDAVVAKTGDAGDEVIMVNPGRFPILEMPFICDVGTICTQPSQAVWDFWQAYPTEIGKEFADIQILAFFAAPTSPVGYGISTPSKPIRTLDDTKGLKVGGGSMYTMQLATAMGMAPMQVPPNLVYDNLSKGVIDAYFTDAEMLDSFKLADIIKYYTQVNFLFSPFWFGYNKDSWNKLPADIQKIMQDDAAKIPGWSDAYSKKATYAALEAAKTNKNLEVITISDDELAKWQALQDPIQQEFLTNLAKSEGVDAQKMFDTLTSLYAKYSQ